MPRGEFVTVCVAARQPSPALSWLAEQTVPRPASRFMIPEVGSMTWMTLLTSSATKTFPKESTSTPPRPAAPNSALTARQPSPSASPDLTPAGRLGHCVPEAAVMGDVPASVVIVYGNGVGDWAGACERAKRNITDRKANETRRIADFLRKVHCSSLESGGQAKRHQSS